VLPMDMAATEQIARMDFEKNIVKDNKAPEVAEETHGYRVDFIPDTQFDMGIELYVFNGA